MPIYIPQGGGGVAKGRSRRRVAALALTHCTLLTTAIVFPPVGGKPQITPCAGAT